MANSVCLPKLMRRDGMIRRICLMLESLPMDKAWRVSVEEAKNPRSLSQNALLWALYGQIIQKGGEAMAGYTKEELHEVMLEQFSGFERYTLFGVEKTRALERSSKMNKQVFSDFIDHIVRLTAGMGIVLDLPEGM